MLFQAYAVANKGTHREQRELLYFGPEEHRARSHIRAAIARGFDYGYIKQGFETVAYLTEKAFLVPVQRD